MTGTGLSRPKATTSVLDVAPPGNRSPAKKSIHLTVYSAAATYTAGDGDVMKKYTIIILAIVISLISWLFIGISAEREWGAV
jgi:hypothetical protein